MNAITWPARVLAIAWWIGANVAQAAESPSDAQNVFARVSPSVVTVLGLNDKGTVEVQGSGVVVGEGLVATNCHVVQEAASLRVTSQEGEFAAQWTRQIPAFDLCLLAASGLTASSVPPRPSATLQVGEPVFAVGNPLGFGLAVSAGLVAMVRTPEGDGYAMVIATAAQSPGSSGGGLFDSQGRLVGLTTAVLGTGQNLNRVVSADGLADLLRGERRPAAVPPIVAGKLWDNEARALQEGARWAELEAHGSAWSLKQPTSVSAWIYVAVAQVQLARPAQAEVSARKAIALDGDHYLAWLTLANALHAQGRLEAAEQAMQEAEKKAPLTADTNRQRATWLRQAGKLPEAVAQYREAVRRSPSSGFLWIWLGEVEDQIGHSAQAEQAYATALRLGSEDARVKARQAELALTAGSKGSDSLSGPSIGDSPETKAQLAIGWQAYRQSRFAPAEAAMRAALVLSPNSANAWNALGAVLQGTARPDQADDAFTRALAVTPNDAGVLTNRAETRRGQKRYELALVDARQATQASPDFGPGWVAMGRVLFEQRDFKEAAVAFARAIEIKPLGGEDQVSWAECLLALGKTDEALVQLRAAEASVTPSPRLNLSMAKVLGAKNDVKGALAYIDKALAADPAQSVAWSSKGYGLMKLDRLPEAVQALETAVRLDPSLSNGWINLGEAQLRSRNLGRAIEALEKGVALAPAATDARLFLAQSYLGAQIPAKSREQAEMLLARQPNFLPALVVLTVSYLMESNATAASEPYLKLRMLAPEAARAMRSKAMEGGILAAWLLPE